jgi:hypothetical protein
MSEERTNESSGKRMSEDGAGSDPPDVIPKRSRGPADCLNWDESDKEEFTPYTQENPQVVFPTPEKKMKKKGAKNLGVKKSSGSKGKMIGNLFCFLN